MCSHRRSQVWLKGSSLSFTPWLVLRPGSCTKWAEWTADAVAAPADTSSVATSVAVTVPLLQRVSRYTSGTARVGYTGGASSAKRSGDGETSTWCALALTPIQLTST